MQKTAVGVIIGLMIIIVLFIAFKSGNFTKNGPKYQRMESKQGWDPEQNPAPLPPQPATSSGNDFSQLNNGVVYSGVLTSGTGDAYCAQHGLVCTNLVSCQLEMGGCNPSEYCGDPRTPECPCTARCAPSKDYKDDQGQCGSCRWVDIECSQYGGVWTGTEVACDPQHQGVIVMKHHQNDCGPQHLEWYTREKWNECFTPRAQCVCN
jgi:hypothetical protein